MTSPSLLLAPYAETLLRPGTVWLDTARTDADAALSRGLLFVDPSEVLTARTASEVFPLLDALDGHLAAGHYVAGFLSYEAAYAFEPNVFGPPADALLGWFGIYEAPEEAPAHDETTPGTTHIAGPHFVFDREGYAERIARIKEAIREGEVYQINFTAPLHFGFEGDPLALYRTLRARQRVPYGALLSTGEAYILSFSPELFFRLDASVEGRSITARPMKGTVHRGDSSEEDARLAAALAADPKNRAENLMIVDLLRNDLARVSEPGSVAVPHLFAVEQYETVLQMTSTVTADLRPEKSLGDIFRALFPCGSVTGAPKLRAMQLIHQLEDTPRGVYCGAIGYAGPDEAVFSVPIRTAILKEGEGTLGIGSGVVWDSEAEAEYDECLLKARFLTDLAE